MPIGTGASFTLGVSPVNLGYLLPLVITLGSYKLSRQFVIVPLIYRRIEERLKSLKLIRRRIAERKMSAERFLELGKILGED